MSAPTKKGAAAPFSISRHVPRLRGEALMAEGVAALRQGRWADALVTAEGLLRESGGTWAAAAALRARALQGCGSPLASRAWDAAWSCDPENAALQDAMLESWANVHSGRSVAALGASFLPLRCREGTHAQLLQLLRRCGLSRVGACWPDGDRVAVMCFDLAPDSPSRAAAQLVVADESDESVAEVPLDGSLVHIDVTPRGAWSVAFAPAADDARPQSLQGSPVVFARAPQAAPNRPRPSGARTIDIIIPVYKDRAAVRTCIKSVLATMSQNAVRTRVIVVDDASPDSAVSAWLDGLARSGWITLLRNRFNLGFIESVNRALRESDSHDTLMLNADTEVFGDWIDRLAAALDAKPDVASVMPWSNNGQIASLWPEAAERAAPPTEVAARIDAEAAALMKRGRTRDLEIPTCSGFAMLMRRDALRDVGQFDGAALTRGYLEEVDWCLRARENGWRHRLATGVFITHNGSASFGAEKALRVRQNRAVIAARYPGYYDEYASFLASGALARARAALQRALRDAGVLWPREDARASAPRRPETLAPLPASSRRFAVRTSGSTADSSHLLALARRLSAMEGERPRLLVFGHVSEALRHTDVVDVIPPDTSLGQRLRLLTDDQLMQLCGCEERAPLA